MGGFIVFITWFAGAVVSARIYYKRRCGIPPASGEPGIMSAVIPSLAWPLVWFVEGWRKPPPCSHPAHAGYHYQRYGINPAAVEPRAESEGFNEGDRVRLVAPFWAHPDPDSGVLLKDWDAPNRGEAATYPSGSKGTIIYPDDASPEFIEDMKAHGKYLVAMEDGKEIYAGGPFPGVEGAALERIPGQYQVVRNNGRVDLWPKFNERDRVRLKTSVTSKKTGCSWEAGSEGFILPLAETMDECWRTGYYNVWLDPEPARSESGIVELPADILELVLQESDS